VWAYFGATRFADLSARHDATACWKPVRLGELFAAVGALCLGQRSAARQANRLQEIARWAAHLGMRVNPHPQFFPTDPDPACRLISAAVLAGADGGALAQACLAACWRDQRDIADAHTLVALADGCGLDGRALLRQAGSAEATAQLDRWTGEAIARGALGSPSYLVDEQMFFGQDRLDFLDRYLSQGA